MLKKYFLKKRLNLILLLAIFFISFFNFSSVSAEGALTEAEEYLKNNSPITLEKPLTVNGEQEKEFYIDEGKIYGEDCGVAALKCELNYNEKISLLGRIAENIKNTENTENAENTDEKVTDTDTREVYYSKWDFCLKNNSEIVDANNLSTKEITSLDNCAKSEEVNTYWEDFKRETAEKASEDLAAKKKAEEEILNNIKKDDSCRDIQLENGLDNSFYQKCYDKILKLKCVGLDGNDDVGIDCVEEENRSVWKSGGLDRVNREANKKEQIKDICNDRKDDNGRQYGKVGFNGICGDELGNGWFYFITLLENLLKWVIGISFLIATLALVWNGVLLLVSNKSESELTKTKDRFKSIVKGLILISSAWLIVAFIFNLFGVKIDLVDNVGGNKASESINSRYNFVDSGEVDEQFERDLESFFPSNEDTGGDQ